MDTKRFSQEDLAAGMQAMNAQTGSEPEREDQNQVKNETIQQEPKTNSGKRVAATVGAAAVGGVVVGGAAMAANAYLNTEEVDTPEENPVDDNASSLTPKHEQEPESPTANGNETHVANEPETVEIIDVHGDGIAEIKGIDTNGDGNVNEIVGDLNGDGTAEIKIEPIEGEENEYVTNVDLNGDSDPDIVVHTFADGTSTATIINDENVINLSDMPSDPEPLDDPVASICEDLNALDDPASVTINDPDELLAEDPVVPSDIDENGDLFAHEFEDDPCGDLLDGVDDINVENIDMV